MTAMPQPMTADEIARHMDEERANEQRVLDEANASGGKVLDLMEALKKSLEASKAHGEKINLGDFVRDSFDSILAHVLPPKTPRDAEAMIEHLLAQRFGRKLNKSEQVKVGIAVATEWNTRRAAQ